MLKHYARLLYAFVILLGTSRFVDAAEYSLPDRVRVLPLAFVPTDQQPPSAEQQRLLLKHLEWAQRRYREMLNGDTFEVEKDQVDIVRGTHPLDYYRQTRERGAPDIVAELLAHYQVSRFECPYVFCIMLMNSKDSFPEGGGRTINGGMNTGGGMMYIASGELTRNEHYQATLQHELGHAFGLPHPDVYGYDIKTNASVMSYNPAHHNKGFMPSATPGRLIPEDRRALAMNDRVFARTEFDSRKDVPRDYSLSKSIIPLGPMELPGLPDFHPLVTTTAGEKLGSKVVNIVREEIKPSSGPGITFDPRTMWHSDKLENGFADLQITFPMPVRLNGLAIHSQHSGIDHHVTSIKLSANDGEASRQVVEKSLKSVDERVTFEPTESKVWSLRLQASASRLIVIRGLRFFDGDEEVLPRMVPYREVESDQKSKPAEALVVAKETPPVLAVAQNTTVTKTVSQKTTAKSKTGVGIPKPEVPKTAEEAITLVKSYVESAEEAIQAEDYDTPVKLMQAAADVLRKPIFKGLRDEVLATRKYYDSLKDAYDLAKPSKEKLKASPNDPAANLAWGRFVCFYRKDWGQGLLFLSKGEDKKWAPVAKKDLDGPTTADGLLSLGDDWFQAGDREREPIRSLALIRADETWQAALKQATGTKLQLAEIEQKVDQRILKLFGNSLVVTNGDAAGVALRGTERFVPQENFTIEFWVSTTAKTGMLLSKRHVDSDVTMLAHVDGGVTNLSLEKNGGGSGSGGGPFIADGHWHHVALVKQGSEITLWVDGQKATRTEAPPIMPSTSPWKFGCSKGKPPCVARFGGIRISNSARYTDGFTPARQHLKDGATLFP